MEQVVNALASCDEVRLGNLVVKAPNTEISDMVFFVVDPNLYGAVIEAVDVTVRDCSMESLCNKPLMTNDVMKCQKESVEYGPDSIPRPWLPEGGFDCESAFEFDSNSMSLEALHERVTKLEEKF
jgi:hypothetical protein